MCCRTDTAAATAQCLHLNHGTSDFEHLNISDVAPDGSALLQHQSGDLGRTGTGQASGPRRGTALTGPEDGDPVKIPAWARTIFAAHLAHMHSYRGPHHARVSKDVRFSLRYGDDAHRRRTR